MFLLRAVFWLSVVILLVPGDPENGTPPPRVSVFEALGAARATIADMSAFCERNPDVCQTGSAAFRIFADKAESGVRMLYRFIDGDGAKPADGGTGTLTPDDIAPPWRDPAQKDGAA